MNCFLFVGSGAFVFTPALSSRTNLLAKTVVAILSSESKLPIETFVLKNKVSKNKQDVGQERPWIQGAFVHRTVGLD